MRFTTKTRYILFILSVLIGTIISACSSSVKTVASPADDTTPVTLTYGGFVTEAIFNQRIGDLIRQKFPHYTINYIQYNRKRGDSGSLDDLVSKGQLPDILEGGSQDDIQNIWVPLGINFDLTPLIQKYKIDTSQFDPAVLNNIRSASAPGQLDAIPLYDYETVLYFNKNLFDKAGVAYPKDGMTWPAVYDVAKQVTQRDGSVRGLEPDDLNRLARQYPLLYLDPKTDKAILTDDQWVNVMKFLKDVYSIPGNLPSDTNLIGNGLNSFFKDQNVAMFPQGTDHWDLITAGFNWDMVSYPTWPDAPGQGPSAKAETLGITPNSQYKDQAFKVLEYVVSQEVQTHLSKTGLAPSLNDKYIQKVFGADIPVLKGKNTQALFFDKLATVPKTISPYDYMGSGTFRNEEINAVTGTKDINTALRDAADALDKRVQTAKQQK